MSFVQMWPIRIKKSILFIAIYFYEWMSSLYLHFIYYHSNLHLIIYKNGIIFKKKFQWIIFCEEKLLFLEYSWIFYSWHEKLKIYWLFYEHVLKLSLYHINNEYWSNLENIMIIVYLKICVLCTSHEYVVAIAICFQLVSLIDKIHGRMKILLQWNLCKEDKGMQERWQKREVI